MRVPTIDREAERGRLAPLADAGLSAREAATILGLTKNAVLSRARTCGVKFRGPLFRGGGCNSAQARNGWATRRARDATVQSAP